MIGQTVSHYRVLSKLGGGGMGVVYEAEDLKLGRRVALKFLPEELGAGPAGARAAPARGAGRLLAPAPQHLHDLRRRRDTTGRPFIAMELLEGETLRDRLGTGAAEARRAARPRDARSPTRSRPRTRAGSSTATSSRPTSSSRSAGRPSSSTSGWPSARTAADEVRRKHGAAHRDGRGAPDEPRHGDRDGRLHVARSRRAASRSTRAPTSSPAAPCSTRWRRDGSRSPEARRPIIFDAILNRAPVSPVQAEPGAARRSSRGSSTPPSRRTATCATRAPRS